MDEKKLLLSKQDIMEMLSVSSTTMWRLEKRKDFPQKITISSGVIRWFTDDVKNWLANKAGLKNDTAAAI